MEDVACREFSLKMTAWIQKIMKQSERKKPGGAPGGGRQFGGGDGGRAKKVGNLDQQESCRLCYGE